MFQARVAGPMVITLCAAALLCMSLIFAGCTRSIPFVHQVATDTAAVASTSPPSGTAATQPIVETIRPAVQAISQASGPIGEQILGIIAAIATVVAGVTATSSGVKGAALATTTTSLTAAHKAVSELHKVIVNTPSAASLITQLSPSTQRVITAATS